MVNRVTAEDRGGFFAGAEVHWCVLACMLLLSDWQRPKSRHGLSGLGFTEADKGQKFCRLLVGGLPFKVEGRPLLLIVLITCANF